MSKYVNKKHGLIIGSDNIFFITNDVHAPEGVEQFRDGYRAIVWPQRYTFDSISYVNVFIRTPAEQLIWDVYSEVEPYTPEIFGEEYKIKQDYLRLNSWCHSWLNANVGKIHDKWDIRTKDKAYTESGSIFFKRRKDALAFVKMIEDMLKGQKFGY